MKTIYRRYGRLAVAVMCLPLLWSNVALAQTLTWGSLVTHSGPTVYDWQLQDLIDEHFEDGSKGNGTVDSNILVVGTSCYFGDFFDNLNGTTGDGAGGGAFDTVKFTDITSTSAQQAGKTAIYGGYDDDAAGALKPGATASQVHTAGTSGKAGSETPISQGSLTKTVGGSTSTHVLIWAGKPNGQDRSQINDIAADFPAGPNQTVTVLAGDGSTSQGTSHVDGAATMANLESALSTIGALMDDGADEQFVLYVTDHGNIEKIDTSPKPVFSGFSDSYIIDVEPDLQDDWLFDTLNFPTLEIWTQPNLILPSDLPDISINLNGSPVDTLDNFILDQIQLPDLSFMDVYTFADPSLEGQLDPFFLGQALEINNNSLNNYLFEAGMLGSGDIAKPIPEPSAYVLAVIGLVGLGLMRRRARHMKR